MAQKGKTEDLLTSNRPKYCIGPGSLSIDVTASVTAKLAATTATTS